MGTEPEPCCGFIEPNLCFEIVGTRTNRVLRVSFAIEALPPWAKLHDGVSVEFPLVRDVDLASVAAALRQQLREFPQRAER